MSSTAKNVLGGLFGALYLMCFAFPFGLVTDVFRDKLPLGQFFVNQLACFLVGWLICYFGLKFYRELLAEANKPRERANEPASEPDAVAAKAAGAEIADSADSADSAGSVDNSSNDSASELPPRTPK
jgi:hypothetical protein